MSYNWEEEKMRLLCGFFPLSFISWALTIVFLASPTLNDLQQYVCSLTIFSRHNCRTLSDKCILDFIPLWGTLVSCWHLIKSFNWFQANLMCDLWASERIMMLETQVVCCQRLHWFIFPERAFLFFLCTCQRDLLFYWTKINFVQSRIVKKIWQATETLIWSMN